MTAAPATHPPPSRTRLLETALAQAFNAVVITNADRTGPGPVIEYCNPAFCAMTGYAEAELLGRSPRMLQGPRTDPAVLQRLRDCLAQGTFFQGATVNYRKDGTAYHVAWNISPVSDDEGQIRHFVSVQQDITAQVQAQQERDLLAQALNVAHAPVLITDHRGAIVFVNRAFERQTGYAADEVLGRTPRLLHSGAHAPEFYAELRAALARGADFRTTVINRRKDGSLYHASQSISALRGQDGAISHYVSISKDISELVQREHTLREQARHDELTGLLNRRAGEAALQRCQDAATAQGTPYALILGDIDLFKQINDRFGHMAGDRVLITVAATLRANVRHTDAVVRWGGEEFLIVLPGCQLASARELAERMRGAVAARRPPEVGDITMSFGVGAWQAGEREVDLLRRTDLALYAAKGNGRNQVALASGPHTISSANR